MKLECILVEDEPLAARLLEDNISRISFLQHRASFGKASDAEEWLKENKVPLVFLDIQLPGKSGLSLARNLPPGTFIIFITAYEEHALEGFELSAVDYLLKPVRFDRFEAACKKVLEQAMLRKKAGTEKLKIRADYQDYYIDPSDILYVEGLKDYVKIIVRGHNKPILSRMNLKGAEQFLPSQFRRIHKSFIVNFPLVTSISRDSVHIGEISLPVGDTFRKDLKG